MTTQSVKDMKLDQMPDAELAKLFQEVDDMVPEDLKKKLKVISDLLGIRKLTPYEMVKYVKEKGSLLFEKSIVDEDEVEQPSP